MNEADCAVRSSEGQLIEVPKLKYIMNHMNSQLLMSHIRNSGHGGANELGFSAGIWMLSFSLINNLHSAGYLIASLPSLPATDSNALQTRLRFCDHSRSITSLASAPPIILRSVMF